MAARKKKTYLTEFKAWLEGVEEMQDDDWVHNPEQWKKIRGKIESLEEEPPAPVVNNPASYSPSAIPQFPPAESHFDNVVLQTAPKEQIVMNPDAPIAKEANIPVKAPDIDTSKGDYKSAFE